MALELEGKKYVKVVNVDGVTYNCINVRTAKGGVTYNVWGSGNSVTYVVDTNVAYSEDVLNGDSVLSPTTFTPTKSGYIFVGWRTDKTASASVLTSKVMDTDPITLYAVFKRTLTLSYNGNGSTGGSTSSQTGIQYYNNGNTSNPSFTLAGNGFTKTDCKFSKWASGSTSGTQYAAGASVTLSESTTFYAVWIEVSYPYTNGTLASGISLSNFTNASSVLSAGVGASTDEENDLTAYIMGIDMTNYSKMDVVVAFTIGCVMGETYAKYGIDSAGTKVTGNSSTTLTLDISGYSGAHSLAFFFYAKNESDYYGADARASISQIRLYN